MLSLQLMFRDWRPGLTPPASSRALWLAPFCSPAASPSSPPSPLQSVFSAALARYRQEQEQQEESQHPAAPREFLALETQPEGALAMVSRQQRQQRQQRQAAPQSARRADTAAALLCCVAQCLLLSHIAVSVQPSGSSWCEAAAADLCLRAASLELDAALDGVERCLLYSALMLRENVDELRVCLEQLRAVQRCCLPAYAAFVSELIAVCQLQLHCMASFGRLPQHNARKSRTVTKEESSWLRERQRQQQQQQQHSQAATLPLAASAYSSRHA